MYDGRWHVLNICPILFRYSFIIKAHVIQLTNEEVKKSTCCYYFLNNFVYSLNGNNMGHRSGVIRHVFFYGDTFVEKKTLTEMGYSVPLISNF